MRPPTYSPLTAKEDWDHDESDSFSGPRLHGVLKHAPLYLLVALLSAICTALLFIAFLSQPATDPRTLAADPDCGKTPEEAIVRGCRFDMMASSWEAPGCIDEELLDEVVGSGPWKWYRDPEHKDLVSHDEVSSGQWTRLYPDSHYHIAHCVYTWRLLHRAVLRGIGVPSDLLDYNHTVHCSKLILKEAWPSVSGTEPGFATCQSNFRGLD